MVSLLIEAVLRLFAGELGEAALRDVRTGQWPAQGWAAVERLGLPFALVTRDRGGSGLAPQDAFEIVKLSGQHVVPLPVAETIVANSALTMAGLPLAIGPAAIVPDGVTIERDGRDWRIAGTAIRVPWGRDAKTLVVEAGGRIARLTEGWNVASRSSNLAGLPRDTLTIDAILTNDDVAPLQGPTLLLSGAAIRALQITGVLAKILDLTIDHVNDRVRFGHTPARFQANQDELAKVAAQVAAANAAADLAVAVLSARPFAQPLPIAGARVRIGEAMREVLSICQQLHGEAGFAAENRFQLYVTAALGWRDEYGGDVFWSRILGQAAMATAPEGFWSFLVAA